MTIDKIMKEIQEDIKGESLRDREVQRIVKDELCIVKEGHWFVISLLGAEVRIYTSSKYFYQTINCLIIESGVYRLAKENVKARFRAKQASLAKL